MSETHEWVDVDNGTTVLKVEWNAMDRFAPPSVFVSDTSPTVPGSIVRSVRHQSKEITLPIIMEADDPVSLRYLVRYMNYVLDPVRGKGQLQVTAPDGTQRKTGAYLKEGMGLSEQVNSSSTKRWQRAVLVFQTEEPYWLDVATTSQTIAYNTTTATFFPFFPLRLSSSSVFGSVEIDNTGDVQTWPRWTIMGPGSAIYIKNLTPDSRGETKTLNLNVTLMAGESVTIDTTPGVRTITKNDGTNLFPYLSASSSLWPLLTDSNSIQLEMSSATSSSAISVSYERRWLSV